MNVYTIEKAAEIKWKDKSPDKGPEEADNAKHAAVLELAQLIWTGHVIRMPDERTPYCYQYHRKYIQRGVVPSCILFCPFKILTHSNSHQSSQL